jgi:hypothetical protein
MIPLLRTAKTLRIGLVSALIGLFPGTPARAAESWYEVETPYVTVYAESDPASARMVALRLERLRAALATILGRPDIRSRQPTYLYLFAARKTARRYFPGDAAAAGSDGVYLGTPDGAFLVLRGGADSDRFALAYHEYVHAVVGESLAGCPLWLNEGLAELAATFWCSDVAAELGAGNEAHRTVLRDEGLLPMDRLLAAEPDSELYLHADRKPRFHAQAWALTHYLLVGNARRGTELRAYLERTRPGTDPVAAFDASFEGGVDALQRELRSYLGREELPLREVLLDVDDATRTPEVRPLPAAERWAVLGDLLAHHPDVDAARARKHFERALRLDAENARARAGLDALDGRRGQGPAPASLNLRTTAPP